MDSQDSGSILCDYCAEERAVLFCRADSAKLCLVCDLHVHSANDLSRKHVRSQICDNCSSEPVSVRCSTDNLVLCQECDWDAHGNCSVSHERNPVEGFTGCPSALDLASKWGIDLEEKAKAAPPPPMQQQEKSSVFSNWSSLDSIFSTDSWINNSDANSFAVPNSTSFTYANVSCPEISASSKKENSSYCGKHKQLILKQLVQLLKNDLNNGDEQGNMEDLTTPGGSARQGSIEGLNLGDRVYEDTAANQLMQQQLPYTTLLMSDANTDLKSNVSLLEEDSIWGCNPPLNESSQIWDFKLGRSMDPAAPSQLEDGYGRTDGGFVIQSYSDFIKRSPTETTKTLENIYRTQDHKNSAKNKPKKATSSQRRTKSESVNIVLTEPCSSKDVNCGGQPLQLKGESARIPSKVDMELIARNRGNAMLRYKEKKRTRRFDKHIRYESRKARAETRKRVKGRFVKASEIPDADMSR